MLFFPPIFHCPPYQGVQPPLETLFFLPIVKIFFVTFALFSLIFKFFYLSTIFLPYQGSTTFFNFSMLVKLQKLNNKKLSNPKFLSSEFQNSRAWELCLTLVLYGKIFFLAVRRKTAEKKLIVYKKITIIKEMEEKLRKYPLFQILSIFEDSSQVHFESFSSLFVYGKDFLSLISLLENNI